MNMLFREPVICSLQMAATRLPISSWNENAKKKKGKLKVYFLNIIEDQYETAIHLVVMIVITVQIKTDAQKNYTKKWNARSTK